MQEEPPIWDQEDEQPEPELHGEPTDAGDDDQAADSEMTSPAGLNKESLEADPEDKQGAAPEGSES